MNKLIINADDFGLCKSVNESIIECYLKNNLTSATLMVNTDNSEQAIDLAKKYNLNIGLHFNIVRGKSLYGKSTLTDNDGFFFSRQKLFYLIMMNKINKDDVKKEFLTQLNFFKNANLNLSHFDSDNHTHMHPFIFNSILDIINSNEKLILRKVNPFYLSSFFANPSRFLQQSFFKLLSFWNFKNNLKSNDFIVSIYDLNKYTKISIKNYHKLLHTNKKNFTLELMVHPYKKSKELSKFYKSQKEISFVENCIKEYEILTSKKDIFLNQDYHLINFKDLISS